MPFVQSKISCVSSENAFKSVFCSLRGYDFEIEMCYKKHLAYTYTHSLFHLFKVATLYRISWQKLSFCLLLCNEGRFFRLCNNENPWMEDNDIT